MVSSEAEERATVYAEYYYGSMKVFLPRLRRRLSFAGACLELHDALVEVLRGETGAKRTSGRKGCLPTRAKLKQVLFATGDVMAQQGVEKKGLDKHDLTRTGRMAAYGGAIFGPGATKWYSFLASRIHMSTTNRTIAARVACDQFVFAPVNMALFLSSMAYLEGASPGERLQKAYVPGMVNNFLLWPWVQGVNFKFVPLEFRVLVVNFVALGWNCYLSYLNSSGGSATKATEESKGKEGGELPPS